MRQSERFPPKKVSLDRFRELRIVWRDDSEDVYPVAYLRVKCPCASCREARSESDNPLRIIQPGTEIPADVHVLELEPVGHYALRFRFSDGHDTGIYSYDYLTEIAPPRSETD